MKLFFDTSALIKFFHEEEGTSKVTALINSGDNEIWISELARVEFLSALFRRTRNREITDLKQHGKSLGLRTLDALQLSAFSLIAEKDWHFVSADINLCQIVKSQGYTAINPLER